MKIDEFLALQEKQKERKPARLTEHGIQVACVNWFKTTHPKWIILAIPNAAHRSPHLGRMMKDEGLLPGSPDLVIFAPGGKVLFVEMKTKTGRLQDTQKSFQLKAKSLGYTYIVCRSLDEFIHCVNAWENENYG